MSTSSENEMCAGALDGKELFAIEGSEKWRSTPGEPGGARKKAEKPLQTALAAINTAILQVEIMSRFPVRTAREPPKHLHVENMKFFQKPMD